MHISKRIRFEILKRDRFTCQYCGRQAPEVRLNLDHRVPIASGGKDEANNLIAACIDCNLGKLDIPLGEQIIDKYSQHPTKEYKSYANTRFSMKVRIDPNQLDWIRDNKGTYKTLAGKLDEIINFYRNTDSKI